MMRVCMSAKSQSRSAIKNTGNHNSVVLRHQISTTIKHKILRVLHTFGALSFSAGLVCCRRKKDVAIRQNLRRVLPVLRGQRQRREHLIAAMMIKCPTLVMPQSYRSRYGRHATPFCVTIHTADGLGTKTFPTCRTSES